FLRCGTKIFAVNVTLLILSLSLGLNNPIKCPGCIFKFLSAKILFLFSLLKLIMPISTQNLIPFWKSRIVYIIEFSLLIPGVDSTISLATNLVALNIFKNLATLSLSGITICPTYLSLFNSGEYLYFSHR